MKPPNRLLARPPYFAGEGPAGFAFRVASTNCLSLRQLKMLGFEYSPDKLLNAGFAVVPDSPETWREIEAVNSIRRRVPRALIQGTCRWCPLCLQSERVWRLGWEIRFADVCPVHAVWLVDRCRRCGRFVTWERPRIDYCLCGAALGSEVTSACPSATVILARTLEDKATSVTGTSDWTLIRAMRLEQVQQLTRFLGTYGTLPLGRQPQKILAEHRLEISWKLSSLASEVIDGWPKTLGQMVERLAAVDALPTLAGGVGAFYRYVHKALTAPEFAQLRADVAQCLVEHWPAAISRRNRRLTSVQQQQGAWLPASRVRAALGVSDRQMAELVDSAQIQSIERIHVSGRREVLVKRADALRAIPKDEKVLNLAEFARLAGLSRARSRAIVALLSDEIAKPSVAEHQWRIDVRLVEDMHAVGSKLASRKRLRRGDVLLGSVLQCWRWSNEEVAALIGAAMSGVVLPTAQLSRSSGFRGWVYNREQVLSWRAERTMPAKHISVPRAAKELNVKQQVAYTLVKTGLLAASSVGTWGGARIARSELDRFRTVYVSARELAETRLTSPKAIIELLKAHQVRAVVGRADNTCRQTFFRRDLVATALARDA